MKRHIVTLIAILCCHIVLAQTEQTKGSLIVKEYSPDEWKVISQSPCYVDMDDDGEWDFEYYKDVSSFMMSAPEVFAKNAACFYCIDSSQYHSTTNFFIDLSIPFNDTILNYDDIIYNDKNWIGDYHLDTLRYKAAIRNGTEGEYHYGWMEAYSVVTYNYDSVWFYLARTAYCTIPNYPLRWGQTSLHDGVEETVAFATVHPNPTTGKIHIEGEKATEIQVFNALGQLVKTVQNTNEVGLEGQPQGLYLLRVTIEGGKVFSDKVVKE